jgi:hypothetical protein
MSSHSNNGLQSEITETVKNGVSAAGYRKENETSDGRVTQLARREERMVHSGSGLDHPEDTSIHMSLY